MKNTSAILFRPRGSVDVCYIYLGLLNMGIVHFEKNYQFCIVLGIVNLNLQSYQLS